MSETEREREREQIKTPFMLCAHVLYLPRLTLCALSVFFEVC